MNALLFRLLHWWNWRWFRHNQVRLRRIAAWAVHHQANGGAHDAGTIMAGGADRRINEAARQDPSL
jgi:hypothetical protein